MNFEARRRWFTEHSTIGELYADGVFVCFTLEDVARPNGVKIPGVTAIPAGKYRVVYDYSPKFGHKVLHICDVPGFDGIRIHAGNTDEDTEGCVLVGFIRETDKIQQSRDAVSVVEGKALAAFGRGEDVWISVTNEQERAAA